MLELSAKIQSPVSSENEFATFLDFHREHRELELKLVLDHANWMLQETNNAIGKVNNAGLSLVIGSDSRLFVCREQIERVIGDLKTLEWDSPDFHNRKLKYFEKCFGKLCEIKIPDDKNPLESFRQVRSNMSIMERKYWDSGYKIYKLGKDGSVIRRVKTVTDAAKLEKVDEKTMNEYIERETVLKHYVWKKSDDYEKLRKLRNDAPSELHNHNFFTPFSFSVHNWEETESN